MASADEPLAMVETAILETKRGVLDVATLWRAFLDAELVIPSAKPTETINDIEPLLWDDAGEQVIGVFTHPNRAEPFAELAPHLALMTGRKLLDILPRASGLLVNPRSETFTFLISSAQAEVIRRDVA